MTWVMGIDGGGSRLRVAVVAPDLTMLGQAEGTTANPNLVGAEAAAEVIQSAMRAALVSARLSAADIAAAAIGVAGADSAHSQDWLRQIVTAVLPAAALVLSSDHEIALTGAFGERVGILVLAGTGSLACGANRAGKYVRVGGWGYVLGDEGSGYWIGREGLQAVMRAADGRGPQTNLTAVLLDALRLAAAGDLVEWLYRAGAGRTREIAALAEVVLQQAAADDRAAAGIVRAAAAELALAARAVNHRLGMEALPVAFAGGLLTGDNPLSRQVCQLLGLSTPPAAHHTPVIGAAILALGALTRQDQ